MTSLLRYGTTTGSCVSGGATAAADAATVAQARLRQLTLREHQVMQYLVSGVPNKLIAAELGVSQRTIEAHRCRIFEKMKVRNAVQLVRCLVGELPPWARAYAAWSPASASAAAAGGHTQDA